MFLIVIMLLTYPWLLFAIYENIKLYVHLDAILILDICHSINILIMSVCLYVGIYEYYIPLTTITENLLFTFTTNINRQFSIRSSSSNSTSIT